MPNSIAIVTDSTNDIPMELRKKYDLYVVPLTINWGSKQYLDGIDLTAEEFYQKLTIDPPLPTTSQPAPLDFLHAYEKAKADGAGEIVTIVISSAMSGTIGSARTAAEGFDLPVHIVDSKSNSMSLGWQVLAAAREREKGGTAEQMVAAAGRVRQNLHYHIILETLDFLFQGGRIAGAARLVSGVLKIKPQIRVNHETGAVEPGAISRTRSQAIEKLYESFFCKVDSSKPLHVAVLHNAALAEAEKLAARVKEEFHPVELIVGIVSPVLGVHTGPQALALCGYSEE
jgi:DegV family protein with EDD domain